MKLDAAISYLNSESAAKCQKQSHSGRKSTHRYTHNQERSAFVARGGKGRQHQGGRNRRQRQDKEECYRCGEAGHRAKDCPAPAPKAKDAKNGDVCAAFIGSEKRQDGAQWFIDSGATHHMTGNQHTLDPVSIKTHARPPYNWKRDHARRQICGRTVRQVQSS